LQKAWKPKIRDWVSDSIPSFYVTNTIFNDEGIILYTKNKSNFIWLPRIDQHLKILKKCGYLVETAESIYTHKFTVKLYDRITGDFIKMPKAIESTLEKAFDKACEWALENKKVKS